LATLTFFKFTVLPALNPSYSATTAILASTLATCAGIWQAFRLRDHNLGYQYIFPSFKTISLSFMVKEASLNGARTHSCT